MENDSPIADLIDLAAQMRRDPRLATLDEDETWRRDRTIGQDLAGLRDNRVKQVRRWLHRVRDDEAPSAGRRTANALSMVSLILTLLGIILGWGAAMAIFYYDGRQPVNVVHVLALFVGLQLITLILFAITALPPRLLHGMPGAVAVQAGLGLMSPGRLEPVIARLLPTAYREVLSRFIGRSHAHQTMYGRVQKWAISRFSQVFAVAFNLGAIAGALYLIVFSDLAFAWSTTLRVSPSGFHQVTRLLAMPWHGWMQTAEPAITLIETTRFFRLQEGILPGAAANTAIEPAELGRWWPFLIACMVAYGLLPRLGTLVFARWRFNTASRDAIAHTPGVAELCHRMNDELIETTAEQPEPEASTQDTKVSFRPAVAVARPTAVVNWAGIDLDDQTLTQRVAEQWKVSVTAVYRAGGISGVEEDDRVIEQLSDQEAVVFVVKAWEPPLMEFSDFLAAARTAMGKGRPIIVLPICVDSRGLAAAGEPQQVNVWRRHLQRIGDPWLDVTGLGQEEA